MDLLAVQQLEVLYFEMVASMESDSLHRIIVVPFSAIIIIGDKIIYIGKLTMGSQERKCIHQKVS